jgi:2-amino-4-hydroxy-6-hydroxymethyldihydropteridine diphosphokinase
VDCYIALGTNLGDLYGNLLAGLQGLHRCDLEPAALSSVWETEPVEAESEGWFWNMAVLVRSERSPRDMLEALLTIERDHGRIRTTRNAPRMLDLDLLLMGDLVVDDGELSLPHPRMWRRRFVLEPLVEIAPQLRNPLTGRTVSQELGEITDDFKVRRLGDLASCRGLPL